MEMNKGIIPYKEFRRRQLWLRWLKQAEIFNIHNNIWSKVS